MSMELMRPFHPATGLLETLLLATLSASDPAWDPGLMGLLDPNPSRSVSEAKDWDAKGVLPSVKAAIMSASEACRLSMEVWESLMPLRTTVVVWLTSWWGREDVFEPVQVHKLNQATRQAVAQRTSAIVDTADVRCNMMDGKFCCCHH